MAEDEGPSRLLYGDQTRKRIINQTYVWIINLVHMVLDLMPGFIRNTAFRLLLKRAGRRVFFDHRIYIKFPWLVEIGDRVSVNRGVEFYPDFANKHGIVIGSDVYLAPNVRFHAAGHDTTALERHTGAPIVVEDNVWIGAGAIILPGVRIGEGSVVGAGSVVTKDVPPGTIAVGVPARPVERD